MFPQTEININVVAAPNPIPALTCPDTHELSGARSLRRFRLGPLPAGTIHSLSHGFTSGILGNCPKRRIGTPHRDGMPPIGAAARRSAARNILAVVPCAPTGAWTRSVHVQNRNATRMRRSGAPERGLQAILSVQPYVRPASVWRITVSGILSCGIPWCDNPMQYAGWLIQ